MKKFKFLLVACLAVCMAVTAALIAACGDGNGEAERLSDTFTVTIYLDDGEGNKTPYDNTSFKVNFYDAEGNVITNPGSTGGGGHRLDENGQCSGDVSEMEGTVLIVSFKSVPAGYAYLDENGDPYDTANGKGKAFDLTKVSSGEVILTKTAE